jgi:hypothetical protein
VRNTKLSPFGREFRGSAGCPIGLGSLVVISSGHFLVYESPIDRRALLLREQRKGRRVRLEKGEVVFRVRR